MIAWPENDAERNSGRVLRFENPWGTKEQAQNIYNSLVTRGFQYQPYTADKAIVNPAAEIGDAVTVNGTYSGIYKMNRNYSSLMAANIEAPLDEEVDHEFPYEPKQDRIYKREIAESQAAISLTQEQISAEVFRATSAEESLSSAITQTAQEISANVVKKTGGSSSSFGWTLNDNSWELKSNNSTVFKATSSGIEISGKVTATNGKIGGFSITSSSIYNGANSLTSTTSGVYVGTNGIRVNGTNASFRAEKNGNVYLTGDLYIGGTKISAASLRSGAASAYSWTQKDSSGTTQAGRWSTGSGYGYNYNNATKSGTNSYPSYFRCGTLQADSAGFNKITIPYGSQVFSFAGQWVTWQSKTINGITINYLGR